MGEEIDVAGETTEGVSREGDAAVEGVEGEMQRHRVYSNKLCQILMVRTVAPPCFLGNRVNRQKPTVRDGELWCEGAVAGGGGEHGRRRGAQGPGGPLPLGLRPAFPLPPRRRRAQAVRPPLQHRRRAAAGGGRRQAAQGPPSRLLGPELIYTHPLYVFRLKNMPLVVLHVPSLRFYRLLHVQFVQIRSVCENVLPLTCMFNSSLMHTGDLASRF